MMAGEINVCIIYLRTYSVILIDEYILVVKISKSLMKYNISWKIKLYDVYNVRDDDYLVCFTYLISIE